MELHFGKVNWCLTGSSWTLKDLLLWVGNPSKTSKSDDDEDDEDGE